MRHPFKNSGKVPFSPDTLSESSSSSKMSIC